MSISFAFADRTSYGSQRVDGPRSQAMSRLAPRPAGALRGREDEAFTLTADAMVNALRVAGDLESLVHFYSAGDRYAGDLRRDLREDERSNGSC
jgi:hypothetical protein